MKYSSDTVYYEKKTFTAKRGGLSSFSKQYINGGNTMGNTIRKFFEGYAGDLSNLRVKVILSHLTTPFSFTTSGQELVSGNYEDGKEHPVIWDATVLSWFIDGDMLCLNIGYEKSEKLESDIII